MFRSGGPFSSVTDSGKGGTPESQKEFLETLSTDPFIPGLSTDRRKNNAPPIANQFALGYTYQDVLDADHEGTPKSPAHF